MDKKSKKEDLPAQVGETKSTMSHKATKMGHDIDYGLRNNEE